jgi:hypothetical protein
MAPPIWLSAALEIRDGNHRLLGHIIAGRTEIEAIIVDRPVTNRSHYSHFQATQPFDFAQTAPLR